MSTIAAALIAVPAVLFVYAYIGYPLQLLVLSKLPGMEKADVEDPARWPTLSISLPAYNEEASIRGAIEALLAADYPEDRRQIVVISDASTDATDRIVREYADRGVELVRLEQRGGKTAAENAAIPHLRGELVVNTDASVRIRPDALKPLVRRFRDPEVGVASGRDVSVGVGDGADDPNAGEGGYVGYEMWVRSLETRLGGIVGASGCFYAIRSGLHEKPVPEHLSRDFAAALTAREHGFRSVSVDEAVCHVPRARSLRAELRRKARTMDRGLATLWRKRGLLDPFSYGGFAWKLFSHKLCRWLIPATLPLGLVGLAALGAAEGGAWAWTAGATGLLLVVGSVGLRWPEEKAASMPPPVALVAYLVAGGFAGVLAWWKVLFTEGMATWEPTRRASGGTGPE